MQVRILCSTALYGDQGVCTYCVQVDGEFNVRMLDAEGLSEKTGFNRPAINFQAADSNGGVAVPNPAQQAGKSNFANFKFG